MQIILVGVVRCHQILLLYLSLDFLKYFSTFSFVRQGIEISVSVLVHVHHKIVIVVLSLVVK